MLRKLWSRPELPKKEEMSNRVRPIPDTVGRIARWNANALPIAWVKLANITNWSEASVWVLKNRRATAEM